MMTALCFSQLVRHAHCCLPECSHIVITSPAVLPLSSSAIPWASFRHQECVCSAESFWFEGPSESHRTTCEASPSLTSVSKSFVFHSKGATQGMSQMLPRLGAGAVAAARPLWKE